MWQTPLLTHEQLSAGPWQVAMFCSLDRRRSTKWLYCPAVREIRSSVCLSGAETTDRQHETITIIQVTPSGPVMSDNQRARYADTQNTVMLQPLIWGARRMRLAAAVFVISLFWASNAAMAQGYCPFAAFCDAQQFHCHRNCWALRAVVTRPDFLRHCLYGCDRQFNRCMIRAAHRCR